MEQAAAPYFLSKHAHVCVTGDAMVILDQATGKYLSLEKRGAAGLGRLVLEVLEKSSSVFVCIIIALC